MYTYFKINVLKIFKKLGGGGSTPPPPKYALALYLESVKMNADGRDNKTNS